MDYTLAEIVNHKTNILNLSNNLFNTADINQEITLNEELIKLGVPNKVEHREIDFSAIEIPEEELVFLKLIFDEISKQLTNDKSADTNNETDIYKTITKKEKE